MAMKFTPKSEAALVKENDERNTLWPKGEYDFEVVNYEDTVSKKSGADMIHLELKVYHPDGGSQTIHDYLLASMMHKLRHACEAIGILDRFEEGTLEARDFDGGVGKVMLKIDKAKPNSGYRDKNSVDDYLKPAARPTAPARGAMAGASPAERRMREMELVQNAADRERAPKKSQTEIDDEIPF